MSGVVAPPIPFELPPIIQSLPQGGDINYILRKRALNGCMHSYCLAMMNMAAQKLSATAETCSSILAQLLESRAGILGAVMATVDCRIFACSMRSDSAVESSRIAAVSGSLLALSESFGNEALRGEVRYSSIVTNRGTIVTVRVPSEAAMHTLCVWVDPSENFAMTLRFSLDTARKLAGVLDEQNQLDPDVAPVGNG